MSRRREYDQACSLASALDRIGERWSLLIVRELMLGPLRFSDLVRNVGNAPTDMLTKRLRDLESHDIVRRRELDLPATGVAYELTELGWGLERPMLELGRWGMHFERAEDVAGLEPTSLANAIRLIVQPPGEARLSVGLRSGGLDYTLRVENGWVAAARGEAVDAEVTLTGEAGRCSPSSSPGRRPSGRRDRGRPRRARTAAGDGRLARAPAASGRRSGGAAPARHRLAIRPASSPHLGSDAGRMG